MSALAFLCPGQGAQHVGMGADLGREFPVARRTFEEADDALGSALSVLCREGPEEALRLTENAQPALLSHAVAVARVLRAEGGLRPAIAAGHSLGEWSAWVIVGALDFAEVVLAVRERGRLMQAAVRPGEGAMSAVFGTDLATVAELCHGASVDPEIVVPANLNGGGQIVVAGHVGAVARLEDAATARGCRASRLKVSAPFHSPLMAPAAEGLAPVFASLSVKVPSAPVVTNVEAEPLRDADRIVPLLREQITAPVRWEECARVVVRDSEGAIEVGPGRVLSGLMRRIERAFPCRAAGDVDGVRAVLAEHRA